MKVPLRVRRSQATGAARQQPPHRVRRLLSGATAVVVVMALLAVGISLHRASSSVDAFYRAPTSVPTGAGRVVRTEPFTNGIPKSARAWRIVYTTTREDGRPALASGIVVLARHVPAGPRPVLAWAHGTSGEAQTCAPSMYAQPWGSGIHKELGQVIRHHWLLVAPDYTGLGTAGPHPYLIGRSEARSMLDAVRAVRRLKNVSVSKHTVVWGLSQGGGAALWTRQIQPTYAPDVPLDGVTAISATSDMPALARRFNDVRGGMVFMAFILTAYAQTYPDVRVKDYADPAAQQVVKGASERCLRPAEAFAATAVTKGIGPPLLNRAPTDGALGSRLRQNTPTATNSTPLMIAQGGADRLVPASIQRAYAKSMCARGQRLDYREYPGRGHGGVAHGNSPLLPQLITWTEQRLAGDPAPDNCARLHHSR